MELQSTFGLGYPTYDLFSFEVSVLQRAYY